MCTESGEQERKGERNREGGWEEKEEVVSERGERSTDRELKDRKQKTKIRWKEVEERRKEKRKRN